MIVLKLMAKGFKTFLDNCEIIGKTGLGSQASEIMFYEQLLAGSGSIAVKP